jgi:hypothetical protein
MEHSQWLCRNWVLVNVGLVNVGYTGVCRWSTTDATSNIV